MIVVKVARSLRSRAPAPPWPGRRPRRRRALLPALDVRFFAYARREGTGAAFAGAGTTNGPVVAAAVCAVAVAAGGRRRGAAPASGGRSWRSTLAVAVVAVTLGVQALVARRLGGLTGDVYGLGIELAEAVAPDRRRA